VNPQYGTIAGLIRSVGGTWIFLWQVLATAARTRGNGRAIIGQMAYVSWRSLATVVFSGAFVGAIMVVQFSVMLGRYDALSFLGGLNTSSLVREVGPLLISFLLAGKIGAFTAAELGTMRVTEQIDAVECLGTDPIQYLVVPRFFGIVLSSLFLLEIGLIVSITGAMGVAVLMGKTNVLQFAESIPRITDGWAIFSGMFKSVVFGTIVAAVCCYQGFTASGGARGVGRAVTMAAVYTNFFIVMADFGTSAIVDFIRQTALNLGWVNS
jgi:phospholipid/cholesterol/gamma-HCH transport system permease protein